MADHGSNAAPIIKKVKKVSGGGHHGGAWKVAYADFVTAMMAFFLLMWLLNATSDEQKQGLAEYFVETIPLAPTSGGGDGAFKGDSLVAENDRAASGKGAAEADTQADESRRNGAAAAAEDGGAEIKDGEVQRDAAEGDLGEKALAELEEAFEAMSGESDVADTMLQHIRTRVTEDGLVIEVFDVEGAPLFAAGSAAPTPTLTALLEMIASVARVVTNGVAISGHTDATPMPVNGDDGNWALSSARADAARRVMTAAGLSGERIQEVSGRAGVQPLVDDPADPRNRRVEITLLR
jgi:chemotaxis protein MotB